MLVVAFGALGGVLFDRIGRIEASWAHLYDSIWAGLALTVLGRVVWHFFLPVSAALGPFALLSVVAIVVERRWFRPLLQIRSHLPTALGFRAGGLDGQSLAGGQAWTTTAWFRPFDGFDYPLVPGLANFTDGSDSTIHHLLAALLSADAGPGK
jgi:hypothetical protein